MPMSRDLYSEIIDLTSHGFEIAFKRPTDLSDSDYVFIIMAKDGHHVKQLFYTGDKEFGLIYTLEYCKNKLECLIIMEDENEIQS